MKSIQFNSAYYDASQTSRRYRILYGGAGSGKSHFVAQEIILRMQETSFFKVLIVRKTAKSIRDSVFRLLCELISEYNLSDRFTINKSEMSITCVTGSQVITSGLDNVEKLKSISGINRIWIEEASEITKSDFHQLDLRLRGRSPLGFQMTLTFNPISELHWIKQAFFDSVRYISHIKRTTYLDNAFLDRAYVETLNRLKEEDYQYYRIYALGEWGSLGNVIYTNWEHRDLSQESKSFDNFYNGLDWGFAADPFAAVRVHYDKMRKTIYVVDEIYRAGLHNDESCELVRSMVGTEMIIADSSEPKSVSDFVRSGVHCKGAKKGPGSIEHGVRWLQGQKIVVDSSCHNFLKEISGYKWREDKDGNIIPKPVDYNNHLLDALRYALEPCMAGPKQLKAVSGLY